MQERNAPLPEGLCHRPHSLASPPLNAGLQVPPGQLPGAEQKVHRLPQLPAAAGMSLATHERVYSCIPVDV